MTIVTATIVVVRGLSTGYVAEDILSHNSAGTGERLEVEGAQARCHCADPNI